MMRVFLARLGWLLRTPGCHRPPPRRAVQRHPALRPALSAAGGPLRAIPLPSGLRGPRHSRWLWGLALAGIVLAAAYEVRTSALQSWLFSRLAARLVYTLGPGRSPRIAFPRAGPFDQRLGYTRIPEFERRLEARGFRVAAQVRFSRAAARLARWGIFPPYREPDRPGLTIRDATGEPVYDGRLGHRILDRQTAIPSLLVTTLLFLENRRLQEAADPQENPVVDWPRLVKAGALYAGRELGLPLPREGGSTLATQLEKFEHSPRGLTASPFEKLRQMVAASLRVYREGTDTRGARQDILLQYLDAMPLAATPAWGEVNGLSDGLAAWFGLNPAAVLRLLASPAATPAKARAYKAVLALLCATRAPSYYLVRRRAALEALADYSARLLERAGALDRTFAERVRATPIPFAAAPAGPSARLVVRRKAITHLRVRLGALLGEPAVYPVDRLHLEADSTLDWGLQQAVAKFFDRLQDPAFLARHGLLGRHLLGAGDPGEVAYSFLLLERTALGNAVRVHTDTLDAPFDLNDGMRMELGSTAKLRTAAYYLEIMADLYREAARLDPRALRRRAQAAHDPLTRWTAETLAAQPRLTLEAFLEQAMGRTYSASPAEAFFTGGGLQTFGNYAHQEDGRVYSLRDGLIQSVNLVYIRLMRDILRFEEARLPYDAAQILANPGDPVRRRLLEESADAESRSRLAQAYREYRGRAAGQIEARLLGRGASDPRRLAMLFFAWHPGADEAGLGRWLAARGGPVAAGEVQRLARAYGGGRLSLADFGYLLDRQPLEVWTAGELARQPGLGWTDLLARSAAARRIASAWLFRTRNRHAQDLRLRTRMEADAFARMTPAWQRLGFPFDRLVPSLATAIGSSADRPDALADLLGILLNDGVRLPAVTLQKLDFAAGTPYETVLERAPAAGAQVLPPAVARVLRGVLAGVVAQGTAGRLAGVFVGPDGAPVAVGGKTGSGDNRFKTFAPGDRLLASRPVSRTAAFAFYLGDRYVGVITASINGPEAGEFDFTSVLPVTLLRLLAPTLEERLRLVPPLPA